MHTREIQLGLRRLLAQAASPPGAAERAGASARGTVGPAQPGGEVTAKPRPHIPPPGRGTAPAPHCTRRGAATAAPPAASSVTGTSPAAGTPVAGLLGAITDPSAQRQLERLAEDAELERPAQVDSGTAARMVRPYTWLLNWVGPSGIRLTDAGHLPPARVSEAAGELDCWGPPGGRRENQVRPVRLLRESAQAMGLLQKQRGRLVRTARGAALRSDPAALWWHLAEGMPLRPAVAWQAEPGLILLLCVAARRPGALPLTIARLLTAIGWAGRDGRAVTSGEAAQVTSCTAAVLRRLGALADGPRPAPTPDGALFARAALRTWPSA